MRFVFYFKLLSLPLVTEKTKLCLDTNKVYKTLEKKLSNNLLTNNLKKVKLWQLQNKQPLRKNLRAFRE